MGGTGWWSSRKLQLARMSYVVLVGAGVFTLAFRNGTYDLTSRAAFAIVLAWLIVLIVIGGFASVQSPSRPALLAGGGLLAFAALAGSSMAWSPSAGSAYSVLGLDLLYALAFVFVVLLVRPRSVSAWCDGIALGICIVAIVSLVSRLFPSLLGAGSSFASLPSAQSRLSYPVGYWNGVAALLAIGVPLLLRSATADRRGLVRAASIVPFPIFGAVLYLTSSRGGVLAAALGGFVFVLLASERIAALVALAVGGAGALASAEVVSRRHELANGPFGAISAAQGHSAAYLIALLALGCGVVYLPFAHRTRRFGPALERGALALAVILAAGAVIASHPLVRLHGFTQPLAVSGSSGNYVQQHLFSSSGNGRWDMWSSAMAEFRAHPFFGGGAGAFQSWWEQHRTVSLFVKNAHSLYLETLGELGGVGLALVALVVLTGVGVGVHRAIRGPSAARGLYGALTAGFIAYCVGAGFDWLWQIPGVTVVAIVLLALITAGGARPWSRATRFSAQAFVRVGILAAALCAIVVEFVALASNVQVAHSQADAARGRGAAALRAASSARDLEPWASTPFLQLALLEERFGSLHLADNYVRAAIRRDSGDWSLWLVAARIQTELGAIERARASLDEARRLNPKWEGAATG